MDLRKLKTLIELVETSGIAELEIQEGEERVRITRSLAAAQNLGGSTATSTAAALATGPAPAPAASAPPPAAEGHVVKSPMVGTFYRSATPGSKPFVEVGDAVEEGGTLCIVEAMKLMNEIEAERAGEIVKLFVDNGQPVEYGQPLFGLRT